jgi:hypothetical protein
LQDVDISLPKCREAPSWCGCYAQDGPETLSRTSRLSSPKVKSKRTHAHLYHQINTKLTLYIKGTHRIAIATDAWTSSNRIAFLATIATWIDEKWMLHEVLLDFQELVGSHTGVNMATSVFRTLESYDITKKVSIGGSKSVPSTERYIINQSFSS